MRQLDPILLEKNVDARVNGDLAEHTISGAILEVCQQDRVLYHKRFGTMSPVTDEPMREDALFRLASMTKPITAIAAGILISRGQLSVDDRVDKYLPAFHDLPIRQLNEKKKIVELGVQQTPFTVKHLLTHSSGIGCGLLFYKQIRKIPKKLNQTLASVVDYYATLPLDFDPGTAQCYSPYAAFDVLARIIELVSGMGYAEFLQKEIFDPCDMPDTTFDPTDEQRARMVIMHYKEKGRSVKVRTNKKCIFDDCPNSRTNAGAGLVSTMHDYHNFAQMLLHGGVFNGKRLVSEQYMAEMTVPQVPESIMDIHERWGYGVRVVSKECYPSLPVGAYGWSGAYGSHFWVDPVNQVTGIYLKNSLHDGGSEATTAHNFERDVFASFRDE